MKLFGKKRLQISKDDTGTTIKWWRLGILDIMFLAMIPVHIIWGIASATGAEEIFEMQVLPMTNLATFLYWTFGAVMVLHLLLNRAVIMKIGQDDLSYRIGRFPPIRKKVNRRLISSIRIDTKEENFAETPVDRDLTRYHLVILSSENKTIRIKSLSKEDAETVRSLIRDPF